jgi:hypothetical protein
MASKRRSSAVRCSPGPESRTSMSTPFDPSVEFRQAVHVASRHEFVHQAAERVALQFRCPARWWKPAAPATARSGKKAIHAPCEARRPAMADQCSPQPQQRRPENRRTRRRGARPRSPSRLATSDHISAAEWLASPVPALLTILFVLTVLAHAVVGLRSILIDYVHARAWLVFAELAVRGAAVLLAGASVLAVLKIFLGR